MTAIVTCCKDFLDVFFSQIFVRKNTDVKGKKCVKLFANDSVISGIKKKRQERKQRYHSKWSHCSY